MKALRYTTLLATLLITSRMFALEVYLSSFGNSYCGQPMAALQAGASGGVPPYTYTWSTGANTPAIYGLAPGIYSVVVTDAVGTNAMAEEEVVSLPAYEAASLFPISHCNGMSPTILFYAGTENGMPPDPQSGTQHGPGPYTFNAVGYPMNYGEWPDGCGGNYSYYALGVDAPPGTGVTVNYTDGIGCPGTFLFSILQPIVLPPMQAVDISGSCSNGAIGSAVVSVGATEDQQTFRIRLKNDQHAVLSDPCGYNIFGDIATTQTFTGLAPGTYWVVADMDVFGIRNDIQVPCSDSISFVIPDLGITCGLVSGRVYIDNNSNCTSNSGENGVPGTVIMITPGPYYTNTNVNGQYSIELPFGTYQFTEQHAVVQQTCPLSVVVASASMTNRNIGCAGGMALDARVTMSNGAARPGFELLYAIDIDNLTTATTGAVTITVQADPVLEFISTSPAAIIVGNTYTWNLSMTSAFQHREVRLRMRVPPDVGLIGTQLNTSAVLTTANTDVDLSNNIASSAQLVTGSFDPNDKIAVTSSRSSTTAYLVGLDDWIDYTIRFQNTGTDTAFNVVVTDTLPATLDPATIQWGPSSHTCTRSLEANGTLKFIYANILLPDSNVNEPASNGFVSFRIKPRQPVVPGTTITNIANIFFDYNPPVITDPSLLTVTSPGVAISPRVLLGGPYVEATQRMSDGLRSAGLIPLTEPYTALGYTHVNSGGESTTAPVLAVSGDNAIVDWVVVELRNTTSPYSVVATRSALLQRDGDVVATNGTSPVFFDLATGNYRVAIRHRNHLGTMTNTSRALSTTTTVVDFSVSTTTTYGTNAQASVGTRRVLWAGDCQGDGELKYTGDNNDRDLILLEIGGVAPTATSTGYRREDVNMDGVVKYTGADNDRDRILVNIGGTVPTNVVLEQLP